MTQPDTPPPPPLPSTLIERAIRRRSRHLTVKTKAVIEQLLIDTKGVTK